ncbi:hypothetical protein ACFL1H_05765 [Nanoarchaeota archaeon]
MYIPKKYGQSKIEKCPFCDIQSVTVNEQGIPVCNKHKSTNMNDLKCVCGEWLDLKSGKFGPYFTCIRCGNINFNKVLSVNDKITGTIVSKEKKSVVKKVNYKKKKYRNQKYNEKKNDKKEITVRSDELDFL